MDQIWVWLYRSNGGRFESLTPSKVWSRVLIFWSTAILEASFTKKSGWTSLIIYLNSQTLVFLNKFFNYWLGRFNYKLLKVSLEELMRVLGGPLEEENVWLLLHLILKDLPGSKGNKLYTNFTTHCWPVSMYKCICCKFEIVPTIFHEI